MRFVLPASLLALVVSCHPAAPIQAPTPETVNPCRGTAEKNAPPASGSTSDFPGALENLPIADIAVKGHVVLTSTKILATSGLSVGAAFHRADVAKAIVALYRTGEIDDVQITASEDAHRVALAILVRERPFVVGIFAPGKTAAERDALAASLGLSEQRRLDVAELHLRAHAPDAPAVDWEIVPGRNNSVTVCLYPKSQ